jgi:hypothetical protein
MLVCFFFLRAKYDAIAITRSSARIAKIVKMGDMSMQNVNVIGDSTLMQYLS